MTKRRSSSSSSRGLKPSSGSGVDLKDLSSLMKMSSTNDLADQLNAMLEMERRPHYQCSDYLRLQPSSSSLAQRSSCSTSSSSPRRSKRSSNSSRSEVITPSCRTKIVQWLYDCVDYLELPRECVALAMNYVDRFMSSSSSSHPKVIEAKSDATIYQLLSLTSLFIAAKAQDKFTIADTATILVKVSHGSYTVDEILDMEQSILQVLDWRVTSKPSAWCISYHLIGLLAKKVIVGRSHRRSSRNDDSSSSAKKIINSILDFTRLQIELSIVDYHTSVLCQPSSVALAAILNSMDLLEVLSSHEKRMFGRVLKEYLSVKEEGMDVYSKEIEQVRCELHHVFDCQSNNVMGRASTSTFKTLSSSNNTTTTAITTATMSRCSSYLSIRSPDGVDDNLSSLMSHASSSRVGSTPSISNTKKKSSSYNRRRMSNASHQEQQQQRIPRRIQPSPTTTFVNMTASNERRLLEP